MSKSSQDSTMWQSAMSTTTMSYIRHTTPSVWGVAVTFLLSLILWAALQPGMVDRMMSIENRALIERYRYLMGPLCLIPVLMSAISPMMKFFKSPSLQGKGLFWALLAIALTLFAGVLPYTTYQRQMADEYYCREHALPAAYELWKSGALKSGTFRPRCPCQWEAALGGYVVNDDAEIVVADSHAWHPSGRFGVTREGRVVTLP